MYHCAQAASRQHAPKKNKWEGAKPRDKIAMDSFECKGWLHITMDHIAYVDISHMDDHVTYSKIDVPPEIIDFVHKNSKLTPTQVRHSSIKFTTLIISFSFGMKF
ncbi:hypothetical protein C8J57DRAFT_1068963 [Mycena rebaudengoi]|nr:hypothetical protein C8J57DRAFT_1068963 [Mycena rebaudengoi]